MAAAMVLACAAVQLGGCASQAVRTAPPPAPTTHVAYQAHVAPGTPRYEEREDEVSNVPVPVANPAPRYPDAALALRLPRVVVSAKVIVNAEGHVDDVRIAHADAAYPSDFDDAVRDAVSRWQFVPLTFTRFAEVEDAQGNVVDSRTVSVEKRPFSLDYDFSFELHEGKPVVGALAPAGTRRD